MKTHLWARWAGLMGILTSTACAEGGEVEEATQANACATRGASYVMSCYEESGSCGPIPDQVVNVSSDGTFGVKQTCDKAEQDGCTGRGTNCRQEAGGCTFKTTFVTTFETDGSSAESVTTIAAACDDGSSCVSTYSCLAVRQ